VFSPDAMIRFDRWDMWDMQDNPQESKSPAVPEREKLPSEKIISLDSVRKTKA
jgi:hypothetical protein